MAFNRLYALALLPVRSATHLRRLGPGPFSYTEGACSNWAAPRRKTSTAVRPARVNTPLISCQCGTISFHAPSPQPIEKYVCHCRECQKQSASAFGTSAIFPSEGIWPLPGHLQPHLQMWRRLADSGNTVECYFCRVCGVRILHRVLLQGKTPRPTVTVRGGCLEGFTLDGARHIYTRTALVPVPANSDAGPPRKRAGMKA